MKLKLVLSAALLVAFATTAQAQRNRDAAPSIELFQSIPEVAPYFEQAYGYAVWPRIARGGLGVGASRGRGQVFVGGQLVGYSRLVEVSIGLQAGGQTYRQIVFFQNREAFDSFSSGGFEFDASASAVAVTASAQAGAGTQ